VHTMSFRMFSALAALAWLGLGFAHPADAQRSNVCELSLTPEQAQTIFQGLSQRPRAASQVRSPGGEVTIETRLQPLNRQQTDSGFELAFIATQAFEIRNLATGREPRFGADSVSIDSALQLSYDEPTRRLRVVADSRHQSVLLALEATGVIQASEAGTPGATRLGGSAEDPATGDSFNLSFEETRSARGRTTVTALSMVPGQLNSFLACDPATLAIDLGLELRVDFDIALEVPAPGDDPSETQSDSVRVIVSGEERSRQPRRATDAAPLSSSSDGIRAFSESKLETVSRELLSRKVEFEVTGDGLLSDLRIGVAPTPREVITFPQLSELNVELRVNGDSLVALSAAPVTAR